MARSVLKAGTAAWTALAIAACSTPTATNKARTPASATPGEQPSPAGATAKPTSLPTTAPTGVPLASATPTLPPLVGGLQGTVLGLDGLPAANVLVHATLLSNNGGSLISDHGALVVANNGSGYHLLATDVHTDPQGRFALDVPATGAVTVEAVKDDSQKAARPNVAIGSGEVQLKLDYTGSLTGRLSAPDTGHANTYGNTSVYIPGLPYVVVTGDDGAFTLLNVPAGTFTLAASSASLGVGQTTVTVKPHEATTVAALALHGTRPVLSSLSATTVKAGDTLSLTGQNFGFDSNAALEVTVGGLTVANPSRKSNTRIDLTVPPMTTHGPADVVVTVGGFASDPLKLTELKAVDAPQVTVAAGVDQSGFQDGPAGTAAFDDPILTNGKPGSLYFLDNRALRTLDGGNVATIGGTPPSGTPANLLGISNPVSIATDAQGRAIVSDTEAGLLRVTPGAGVVTLVAASALDYTVTAVAVDAQGRICGFCDDDKLRAMPADGGAFTLLAGGGSNPTGTGAAVDLQGVIRLAADPAGGLWLLTPDSLRHVDAQGVVTASGLGELNQAGAIAVGPDGTVYVADDDDASNARLRAFKPGGSPVTLLTGSASASATEGPATSVSLSDLTSLAIDALGNPWFTEFNNPRIRKLGLFTD